MIKALEYKVLVLPDQIATESEGGIQFLEKEIERDEMKQTEGVIVNFGSNAFDDWKEGPEIGDKIIFGKYAGQMLDGDDGKRYRLIRDKDVLATRSQ